MPAAPNQHCAPDPTPAPLSFSGHTPTHQCPSCSEEPKLDTGLEMWFHQYQVQEYNNFPCHTPLANNPQKSFFIIFF